MKTKNAENKKFKLTIILISVIAALGVLALLYLQRYKYYSEHFYPNTVINNMDCSELTLDETKDLIQKTIDAYSLALSDQEGNIYNVSAEQLGLKYKDDGSLEKIMEKQEPLLWIVKMHSPLTENVSVTYTYDEEAIRSWLSSLACVQNGVAPTDAYKEQQEDGYWHIVPETNGNQIDVDKALKAVEDAVVAGETAVSLADKDCYVKPNILSDDHALNSEVDSLNKEIKRQKLIEELTDVSITLQTDAQENDTVTLDSDKLKEMIVDDSDGDPTVSKEKVTEWVNNWAKENDLYSDDDLFVTYDGVLVHLENGTDTGWSFDLDGTVQNIFTAISNKENGVVKPAVKRKDTGTLLSEETYVEISIPDQRMVCYDKGILKVDTPIVTGAINNNLSYSTYTPSNGIWHITFKKKNHHMRGPIQSDGTYEYETDVDYWMPFNGDIGIHDMTERGAFGGDIYINNGSHGCINTPYDAAKQIYNIVSAGTKVVVWG